MFIHIDRETMIEMIARHLLDGAEFKVEVREKGAVVPPQLPPCVPPFGEKKRE